MSKCISLHGEYSDHELSGEEFVCGRCFVFDEDAALATVTALREQLAERDAVIERVHLFIESQRRWNNLKGWTIAESVKAILDAAPSDILDDVKADLIHEAAEAIRAHATAPTELIHPHVQIDPLIAWVADWMENPPEWVKVSYRKTSRKQRADER